MRILIGLLSFIMVFLISTLAGFIVLCFLGLPCVLAIWASGDFTYDHILHSVIIYGIVLASYYFGEKLVIPKVVKMMNDRRF